MSRLPASVSGPKSGAAGEFTDLLPARLPVLFPHSLTAVDRSSPLPQTEATTVLAFRYHDGVLIAGDRRATAGNIVMYDRADKLIDLDNDTVLAIAGSPAVAFEMARTLQTSFQYYRRSQLQSLSLPAKVRTLGKLIKDNLPMTLQGIGAVVPILAAREPGRQADPTLFFYDALGAQFLAADFAVSGSGSPAARSILQWINRWSGQPTALKNEDQAVLLALQLLDVAAESDTATGGVDRRSQIFPQIKLLSTAGLRSIPAEAIADRFRSLEMPFLPPPQTSN